MSTAEKVIKMAQEGRYASDIAMELEVSRQRVSQILRKAGVKARPAYHMMGRRPQPAPPTPRVITGGVSVPITHAAAGTVSELLVAADLLARGWNAFLPVLRNRGHDVIACKGDAVVTIEVRSGRLKPSGAPAFSKKADCISQCYAVVMTGQPVLYEPPLPD